MKNRNECYERRQGDEGTTQKEATGGARRRKKDCMVPRAGASGEKSTRSRRGEPRNEEGRRRATAEARTGLRQRERDGERGGGGRGGARTQWGRHGRQKKEGAKRNKAKPWVKESADEYPSS